MSNSAIEPLRDKPLGQGMISVQSLVHTNTSLHWDLYSLDTSYGGQEVWQQETRDSDALVLIQIPRHRRLNLRIQAALPCPSAKWEQ